jgi:hypothetical protein
VRKTVSEKAEALRFAREIEQGQCLVTTISPSQSSEAAFMQQVIDLAHLYHWMVYHTYDSRRSQPGYPDLAFCHPVRHQYFLAELKAEKGRLSLAQKRWIDALQAANIEIHVWRPSDFSHIVARLSRT